MKWIIALCGLRGARRGVELGMYVGFEGDPTSERAQAKRYDEEERARIIAAYLPARESTEWKHIAVED